MDTKALRQKILDLAIRGKLVPQDPNDEPASVLLERIRAEKQQMVKDGKLKPKDIKNDTIIFVGEDNLHYEKFQDGSVKCIENEIPFEVPEGWACPIRSASNAIEERILASYSKRRTADSKALTSSLEMLLSKLNEVSERNDRQLVEITERMDALETPADSFVTEELAPTAIEATRESELQLSEVRKVGSWDEELKKFCKNNPGMDVDEVQDKFPEYYDRMMREAQKTEEERSIVTRGR